MNFNRTACLDSVQSVIYPSEKCWWDQTKSFKQTFHGRSELTAFHARRPSVYRLCCRLRWNGLVPSTRAPAMLLLFYLYSSDLQPSPATVSRLVCTCRSGQRLPVDRAQRQDVWEGLQVDWPQPDGETRAWGRLMLAWRPRQLSFVII